MIRNCQNSVQFQVMETLGNMSPMPDDVGRNKFEKLGKLLYLILTHVELTFCSDAKTEGRAYIGGYLWNGHEVLSWYAAEVLPSCAPWTFTKNDPQRTL